MKQYKFKVNGNPYEVTINSVDGNLANVTVNGKNCVVEMDGESVAPAMSASAPAAPSAPAPASTVAPAPSAGKGTDVLSPLPGVIIGLSVAVGDKVSAGQSVATLEAMKMENAIESEIAGTVTAVHVQKGDSVLEGAKIVTIA